MSVFEKIDILKEKLNECVWLAKEILEMIKIPTVLEFTKNYNSFFIVSHSFTGENITDEVRRYLDILRYTIIRKYLVNNSKVLTDSLNFYQMEQYINIYMHEITEIN